MNALPILSAELMEIVERAWGLAIVRGLDGSWFREGSYRELVRPPHEDLFR